MKQCPSCKTTYIDDSLQFCLSDGAHLLALSNDEKTVQMSFANERMRVNIPPDSAPTVFAQSPPVVQNQSSKKGLGLLLGGGLAVLLFLIAAGVGAFIFLRQPDNKNTLAAVSSTPIASPNTSTNVSPTVAPNDETARLKEEMANLKKQIENQKNPKQNLTVAPPTSQTSPPNGRTARANSPGDGFLALRSEPDSETGYRITKIPHGAALTVLGCPKASNVGKMAGRWCLVNYNGQSGWAFDGFMTF
ncbi:MAG: SH3 domain-containing protein [Pyrinomonadaceae bacterium]|nr:SH3 domain-containing protein [Pyrinomonadaceae bacterium]